LLALAADAVAAGDVVAASWRCCWRWRPMLLALAMLVALFVMGQTTPHKLELLVHFIVRLCLTEVDTSGSHRGTRG